ncbi:ATP-binding protein [Brevundimonas sp.]|uniref:ATP-binding protein n=1 Tax=Brevundimonas sp. TaxID=1871086 RepID=UPI0026009EB4|nr:ATP-binding protein [Brevundimonas sp.]
MAALSGLVDLARRKRFPLLASAAVLVLVLAGVLIAVVGENSYRRQSAREAGVQAEMLASSVTAALAFEDRAETQAMVNATQVNSRVLAAAVFDAQGRLVASYTRPGETVPLRTQRREELTDFQDGRLRVFREVREAGQLLGFAGLKLQADTMESRIARYSGLAMLLLMAVVAIGVLGAAQAALRRANMELGERAADLAESNRRLETEMHERARAEEALRQSQKMEAIGRLTGGIAHDFNNLLMVASSGVDLMDRTEDASKRERLKAGVKQAIERGAALTKQLLAFSRGSALKPEVVDLAAQVESMRVLLERSLREDIRVVIEMSDDLWPVEVDINELELALLNMAVNARDAMPDGGALIVSAVNVSADREDGHDYVCLSVTDTGTGMSDETMARVFEPFFTTKEVGKGTGLGLSQVYGFVRSSGGETRIESKEGQGTTISMCLPRSGKVPAVTRSPNARPAPRQGRGRVLLVEDDHSVAEMVSEMLRELGYRCERAENADAALDLLEADGKFDIVFSDMVMPGELDGRALAREVRERLPGMGVLLTSGFSAAAAQASAEGFQVLAKPYQIEALGEALEVARSRNQSRASA